jgi:hypothetical protein
VDIFTSLALAVGQSCLVIDARIVWWALFGVKGVWSKGMSSRLSTTLKYVSNFTLVLSILTENLHADVERSFFSTHNFT